MLRVKLKGHLFLEEEVRRLGEAGRVVVGWQQGNLKCNLQF